MILGNRGDRMALTASITPDGDPIRKPHMTVPLPAVGDGPLILTLAVDDPDIVAEPVRSPIGIDGPPNGVLRSAFPIH
jgi:hypothetical protein